MGRRAFISSITETSIVILLIVGYFEVVSTNPEQLLQANPHPFIIIAAVMGLRYGNYVGMISATLTSATYVLLYHIHVGHYWALFQDINYYKFILAIYWAGVVLGIFKDNYSSLNERLNNRIFQLERALEKLGRQYASSMAVNDDLKKQIIGAEYSILSLYEIAQKLDSLNPEAVYTETMGILTRFLKAKSVSIYIVDPRNHDFLRLKIRMGATHQDKRSIDVAHSEGFKRVVLDRQVVKWSDTDEDDFPLMSAPLTHEGKVIAVINVEDMDFDVLSEYAYNLFKVIVEWVDKSIGQAIFVESQLQEDRFHAGTRFMKFTDFQDRVEEEKKRYREFGMEYMLLKYELSGVTLEDVSQTISGFLRAVDIFSFDPITNHIHILLPATPHSAFDIINERVMSKTDYQLKFLEESR